jgi:hypothetical protein
VFRDRTRSSIIARAGIFQSAKAIYARYHPRLNPHGQGFIAATSMNSDGKVTLPAAREIVTFPSSNG